MNPITHRNREIERLEHELAESRKRETQLKRALQPFVDDYKAYLEHVIAANHLDTAPLSFLTWIYAGDNEDEKLQQYKDATIAMYGDVFQAMATLAPKEEG